MTQQAIFVDHAFTPHTEIADAVIITDGAKIVAVGRRGEINVPAAAVRRIARGLTAVPGFVDLHIHGAGGHDVMEGTEQALDAVTASVARHGTTSIVATTVSAGEAETCAAVRGIAEWMRSRSASELSAPRAEILGVHLEGPFISAARRGAHPEKFLLSPSVERFATFLAAGGGSAVCILTLAPELPGALELIDAARAAGVLVAVGHTDATYEQAMRAFERGARHAVHTFNAMRPFSHRESGVIGAVLTSPSVSAELIADGVHVDAAAMRVLLSSKGPRGVILVSDGIAATGMSDGRYRLGTFEVTVAKGVARTSEGKLAGSTLTLERALKNVTALGVPFAEALAMLTANPARALGMEKRKGHLAAGADADMVFLDSKGEVAGVMTQGVNWPKGLA